MKRGLLLQPWRAAMSAECTLGTIAANGWLLLQKRKEKGRSATQSIVPCVFCQRG